MNKRASGPPRRPRNPVAKAVRTPKFKPQVVPDKRWQERLKDERELGGKPGEPGSDKPGK
jgi:hypothetical protein